MSDVPPMVISQEYELVDPSTLRIHPKNPNQGDIGAIAESISFHGFYGVLYAQRSNRTVCAGNHRLQAAVQLGLDEVPVVWLDVDDQQAERILLVDNRTTRLGHDDDALLANILTELAMSDDGLEGTGYDGDFLDELLKENESSPVNPATRAVVVVECESREQGEGLLEQLAGLGFQAKLEMR
jgi:ParB-like chromosome segregation protein Spo0J